MVCLAVPLASWSCGDDEATGTASAAASTSGSGASGGASSSGVGGAGGAGNDGGGGSGGDGGGATGPKPACALRFGDASYQEGAAIAFDGDGNVVVTGTFAGTIDFGGGNSFSATKPSVFVVKLDASCNHLWSKAYVPVGLQAHGQSIATDSADAVLVGGYFYEEINLGTTHTTSDPGEDDMFVLKLDASGNYVWSKDFGDALGDQYPLGLAADSLDDVLVTGNLPGSADFGNGTVSGLCFVAKLAAASGAGAWSKGCGAGRGGGIALDKDDNVVVAGAGFGAIDFGGGALPNEAGLYLAKLEPDGDETWAKHFARGNDFSTVDAAVIGDDDVLLGGSFAVSVDFGGGTLTSAGDADVFAATFSAAGAHQQSGHFGGATADRGYAVAAMATGEPVLAGDFTGSIDFGAGVQTSAGSSDGFVVALDANGGELWSSRFGDAAPQSARDVAVAASGAVAITGVIEGTVDFGTGALAPAGSGDAFVAVYAP